MSARGVTVPVTVEFEDVDAFGIANHARIVGCQFQGRTGSHKAIYSAAATSETTSRPCLLL